MIIVKTIIDLSHDLIKENITKQDVVLDLTVGNGNDTLFLVKIAKFVYGFDIQTAAINQAKLKLVNYDNYRLINTSHEYFLDYINKDFKAAIFNLGYLPGGNKLITTMAGSTLLTLKLVLENIKVTGICVLVVYPGHYEGKRESQALLNYSAKLDQLKYQVIKYEFINQINNPPYLLAIRRLQ
ncbi:MAG: class I SAM-dependent methyltransferase [Bacilli bacterium]|nr:class I SAM-dependent methyltransferase [Bacilli bacterium]MDD4076469.1 class I SAM-dependent methyltransferase [Bacilli bacterium]MDD4387805.1 class I SAM-dependent methyltransferase [Bacilli bacterium]